jgi:hypothetical protein
MPVEFLPDEETHPPAEPHELRALLHDFLTAVLDGRVVEAATLREWATALQAAVDDAPAPTAGETETAPAPRWS